MSRWIWLTFCACLSQKLVTRVFQALYTFVLLPILWYDGLIFRTAPYIPPVDPSSAIDTQNFDDTFLGLRPVRDNDTDSEQEREQTNQEPTDGKDSITPPTQLRKSSAYSSNDIVDLFDGYSFKGRHSVIIEEDEDFSEEEDQDVTGRSILAELVGTTVAETVIITGHEEITVPTSRPPMIPVGAHADAVAEVHTDAHIHHKDADEASALELSDANDEEYMRTERDEEVEYWGFIEADGEERNGPPRSGSFARGGVDQYRLAFRKAALLNRSGSGIPGAATELSHALRRAYSTSLTRREHHGHNDSLLSLRGPETLLHAERPLSTSIRSSLSSDTSAIMGSCASKLTSSTVWSFHSARTTLGKPSLVPSNFQDGYPSFGDTPTTREPSVRHRRTASI
jgi:serum/glucocorticoid-regulated kinase 2